MQAVIDNTNVLYVGEVRISGFTARRMHDDLAWGEGIIQPQAIHAGGDEQHKLLEAVLESVQPVSDQELPFSACTDGRLPVKLLSGEIIPVREQMVGADMVSAFYVAEVLGASFYQDSKAPVRQRVNEVADFLKENGLMPSSHTACGAAGGFAVILQNIVHFSADERFMARVRDLLPQGVYDEQLYALMVAACKARLAADSYKELSGQIFLGAAIQDGGEHSIAELKDDGRGVHGHVEEQIIRVKVPGYSINKAQVGELTGGREVFGVSDARIEKLARLFGRGNDSDYKKAYLALEAFADAGHGTLAKDLPTWVVTID